MMNVFCLMMFKKDWAPRGGAAGHGSHMQGRGRTAGTNPPVACGEATPGIMLRIAGL